MNMTESEVNNMLSQLEETMRSIKKYCSKNSGLAGKDKQRTCKAKNCPFAEKIETHRGVSQSVYCNLARATYNSNIQQRPINWKLEYLFGDRF